MIPGRLVIFLLGLWIGGSIVADFAAFNNFDSTDEFLQSPGSVNASVRMNKIGREDARVLMRRYAGEANASLLFSWERASAVLGMGVFLILLFGERPDRVNLVTTVVMLLIVFGQHFITPQIAQLGERMDDLPGDASLRSSFGLLHGTYSTLELVRLSGGLLLMWRLARRWRRPAAPVLG